MSRGKLIADRRKDFRGLLAIVQGSAGRVTAPRGKKKLRVPSRDGTTVTLRGFGRGGKTPGSVPQRSFFTLKIRSSCASPPFNTGTTDSTIIMNSS